MQYFRDTVTGKVFAFEDNVIPAQDDQGVWRFFVSEGVSNEDPQQTEVRRGDELPGPYPNTLAPTDDPTPPLYVPTLEDNKRTQSYLLDAAARSIAPLQDAVDIGESTAAEEAQLLAWKKYRVALNRLDLTATPVGWPDQPTA